MRKTLPACRIQPGLLRIPGPRDLGKCARPESPRAAQPEPSCLPSSACGTEEVSLRRGEFFAVEISGMGAGPETRAGLAGRNSRPHGSRSNDHEKQKPLRGDSLYGMARESREYERSSRLQQLSSEDDGKKLAPADLARGNARGKRFAFRRTGAASANGPSLLRLILLAFAGLRGLSLQLYDGLANCGLIGRDSPIEERFILQAAALLQEAGRFQEGQGLPQRVLRMIRKISPPPGWTKRDLEFTALVAPVPTAAPCRIRIMKN